MPTICFLGDFSTERVVWNELGSHSGWTIYHAKSLQLLREFRDRSEIAGVFLDWTAESETNASSISQILACLPEARIVACYPIASPVLAEELVSLGAFHSVPRPLCASEVRQSIGFVLEAWRRAQLPKPVRREETHIMAEAAFG